MIQELLYTSHEGKGLRQGGGGGFCTVLSTEGMAGNLAAALEQLSGYKHPFDIHDLRSIHNPVNFRHAIIRIGGITYHVLSRIADLRREHTGRSNKLAHHVALTKDVLTVGGPAYVMMQPDFCRQDWDGRVRLVHEMPASKLATKDVPLARCRAWEQAAGDAGWAGVVADHLLKNPQAPISIIFRPSADTLELTNEVFSLLPPQRRWDTTFSTYFTSLPAGTSCQLRFYLHGTAEADQLRRDFRQQTIDLTTSLAAPPATELVTMARTGERAVVARAPASFTSDSGRPAAAGTANGNAKERRAEPFGQRTARASASVDDELSLLPPVVVTHDFGHESDRYRNYSATATRRRSGWQRAMMIALAVAASLLLMTVLFAGGFATGMWYAGADKPVVKKRDTAGNTGTNANATGYHVAKPDTGTKQSKEPKASSGGEKPGSITTGKGNPPAEPPDGAQGKSSDNGSPSGDHATADGAAPSTADAGNSSRTDSGQNTEDASGAAAGASEPAFTLPKQLPIPALDARAKDVPTLLIDKIPESVGTNIRLIGIESLDRDTDSFSQSSKEDGSRLNVDLTFVDARTLSRKPETVCSFILKEGSLYFEWSHESLKWRTSAKKRAWLVNGLRWCLLAIRIDGSEQLCRLSSPRRFPHSLMPESASPGSTIVDTAIPDASLWSWRAVIDPKVDDDLRSTSSKPPTWECSHTFSSKKIGGPQKILTVQVVSSLDSESTASPSTTDRSSPEFKVQRSIRFPVKETNWKWSEPMSLDSSDKVTFTRQRFDLGNQTIDSAITDVTNRIAQVQPTDQMKKEERDRLAVTRDRLQEELVELKEVKDIFNRIAPYFLPRTLNVSLEIKYPETDFVARVLGSADIEQNQTAQLSQ